MAVDPTYPGGPAAPALLHRLRLAPAGLHRHRPLRPGGRRGQRPGGRHGRLPHPAPRAARARGGHPRLAPPRLGHAHGRRGAGSARRRDDREDRRRRHPRVGRAGRQRQEPLPGVADGLAVRPRPGVLRLARRAGRPPSRRHRAGTCRSGRDGGQLGVGSRGHAPRGADVTGSTTLSDQQPPAGTPEYLDSASGSSLSPLPPENEAAAGRTSRRTTWLVGGGLGGALAIGAGAWAAASFFAQGDQPAEALPSTTIAYASIDLDPSGSQKIDAFRTLNKFPAFKDEVGVHSVDDVRKKLGDELVKGLGCKGLTFADDIDPWLGDRAAVALDDAGNPDPDAVSVIQVTDDGKAEDALKKLVACGDSQDDVSYDVHDGWAVFAGSQKTVDEVVSETGAASLADDATYQKWIKAVGDSGVVNLYAAPAAGDELASRLDSLQQDLGDLGAGLGGGALLQSAVPSGSDAYSSSLTVAADDNQAFGKVLKNFQGAAATIRFTGDGLELATATDPGLTESSSTSDQAGAVVQGLPDDTAAAIGIGLEPGWVTHLADRFASYSGSKSGQHLLDQLGQES